MPIRGPIRSRGDRRNLRVPIPTGQELRPLLHQAAPAVNPCNGVEFPVPLAGTTRKPHYLTASEQVWKQMQLGWYNPRHSKSWLSSLECYTFPRIAGQPVSEVTSADLIGIPTPIWNVKAQTTRTQNSHMCCKD